MTSYLLDTDIASYLIKGKQPSVHKRFAALPVGSWAMSTVSYAELLVGLEPLTPDHPLRIKSSRFLFTAPILDWPKQASALYAAIRFETRRQPIGELDCMIAAHAVVLGATLVTNNVRHFSRVGLTLRLENWVV